MAFHSHYVFDAYGTLFDVNSAAARHAQDIGPTWERLSQTWRAKHLEYSWIWAATGRHTTFWKLAGDSLDFAIASVGGVRPGMREALLDAYRSLDAYGEVAGVLDELRKQGSKLAILTNGDTDMINDAMRSARLEGAFDRVITVHEAGTFKPRPQVYDLVSAHFGVPLKAVSFQSSNRWDITGARVAGMRTVWINRAGVPDEYPDTPADLVMADLTALAGGA